MLSVIILFIGTFWETGMDIIGFPQNYKGSRWQHLAQYFDNKGWKFLGNSFWDNSIAWRNKWKNKDPKQGEAFPFSSSFLGVICDGWHVVKYLWLLHLFAAIVFYQPITPYFLVDMIILYTSFGLGHEIFWRLMKGWSEE
jgi:hypothetical protein